MLPEENKTLQEKADELYALTMHQEDIDNDDLLDDGMQNAYMQLSGERTVSEQIKPISRGKDLLASPSFSSQQERLSFIKIGS